MMARETSICRGRIIEHHTRKDTKITTGAVQTVPMTFSAPTGPCARPISSEARRNLSLLRLTRYVPNEMIFVSVQPRRFEFSSV